MRIAYLGTSEFAAAVLRWLAGSSHSPVLVVTPPDRPRGRGRRIASPPAADAARQFELDLLQTGDVNGAEAVARVRAAAPELGVVCAFGQLIKNPLLCDLEMLNVHPSLLPRWRGAAPIERAIMAGDPVTGVTILRVVAGLDSGPIALQRETAIAPDEDYGSLARRLAEQAGALVLEALDRRASGELEFAEQDDSLATYAHKLAPEERLLDPGRPAAELARRVRALHPHVGTYLRLDGGRRLGVAAASAEEDGVEAGALVGDRRALRLGCAEGVLRLDVVQPPGKRPMSAESYLRGHSVPRLAG